ncbi:acyl-CoA dehydrogenase family protein [Streptomyces hyaluromycini]|uniref:acyl-CoA dehydrogenase family protein n=1 Tax=Streptomyces hyaluromycini TaxID=1377993 RepID=UPI000B5C25DD|nr:acyl-CoA dehydrogenase family protein [Streptomyces hyaluromycini]
MTPDELERLLGDPYDPLNPYGFAAAVARDEQDAFPEELCAKLREAGFHLNYLPREWGGRFESFDRSMLLVRTAARRDLNVMPGTMFGITAATCLALHGSPEQRKRAGQILTEGGAIGFALSEARHGSDLLANTARLEPTADGWELTGDKWLVGLGHRCEAAYVVAKTGERGPAAYSAVFVDLTTGTGLDRGPLVPAAGMRGIDFADLGFDRFPVPREALVGREGEALESVMKAQQVVRVMSMAGSLGIADTALRQTLDFAADRRVGRTTVLRSPYPRRELAIASAALLAADATALAASRGIHVVPETFSVWGCAAKHVVAESTEEILRRCGGVLASRAVLRDGIFQKLQRDAQIVRVVDTSPLANLRSFASQLQQTLRGAGNCATSPHAPAARDQIQAVFNLEEPLPPYAPDRLDLNARGYDPVTAALPLIAPEALARLTAAADHPTAHLVTQLVAAVGDLPAELAAADRDTGLIDVAERFTWLHAAASCLHLWWANESNPFFTTGWLHATLAHLLARATGTDLRREGDAQLPALDITTDLHDHDQLFSALPVHLA